MKTECPKRVRNVSETGVAETAPESVRFSVRNSVPRGHIRTNRHTVRNAVRFMSDMQSVRNHLFGLWKDTN